ncbi:MAG: HD domain-containing protein [Thermoleophilia bacterium]|nr:HD domain-containing protein [Thermoleophilia bacterium]
MPSEIRSYIRSLEIDAYVVGGAVRDELLGLRHHDEDFVVPRVDQAELRALLEPHGRVEDMDVHGQLVGVRLYPSDRSIRALAPAGIELTPPRAERSTGPGHRDFTIVSNPSISLDEDMARRDFTINAMARRLADGSLLDPFDGQGDLTRRTIRTVTPTSFVEDPLRLVRALRFVSQLEFDVAPETQAQMRANATGLGHVSAERIGGGIKADGMGELSKLLLGRAPMKALLLARDTGVLTNVIPEFLPAIGYSLHTKRQRLPLEEHIFTVVQNAADAGARLVVRLAALLHDLGKVEADARKDSHALIGARIARDVLTRLRYPTDVQHAAARIVAGHAFSLDGSIDELRARRFLAEHGEELAFDLIAHKRADLNAKLVPAEEQGALGQLARLVEHERSQPHRIGDLAVTGDDLLSIGFAEGPQVGQALALLLDAVVTEPTLNDRDRLLARAREDFA